MTILRLPAELRDRCAAIARASLPNEACALVAGRISDGITTITAIHPIPNVHASPTSFALDGAAMIAAEERIDEAGELLLGVMHSHPTSEAVPSERDLADALVYDPASTFVQLIVSLQGFAPTLHAFTYGPSRNETVQIALETTGRP